METITIMGIAGSLREGSYNRALLRTCTEIAPEGIEIEIFERLGDIPLYNEDVRAQMHLRQFCVDTNMFPLNVPEVLIAYADERFEGGKLVDEAGLKFVRQALGNLYDWTLQLREKES